MDETGIYHGHSAGVDKYDYRGKKLWSNTDCQGIMFGVQTKTHVYPTGNDSTVNYYYYHIQNYIFNWFFCRLEFIRKLGKQS
jgi:hypothetical protein